MEDTPIKKGIHIIVEGIDHCGKDTLIGRLHSSFGGRIHHCGKPPVLNKYMNATATAPIISEMSDNYYYSHCGEHPDSARVDEYNRFAAQYLYQKNYFESLFYSMAGPELLTVYGLDNRDNPMNDPVIYNRFHLGEFVYGQLYRNYTKEMAELPFQIEKKFIEADWVGQTQMDLYDRIFLIHLAMHHPETRNKDSDAFSMDNGQAESELFLEAFNRSRLQKMLVYVDTVDGRWRMKEEIYNDVIDWLVHRIDEWNWPEDQY